MLHAGAAQEAARSAPAASKPTAMPACPAPGGANATTAAPGAECPCRTLSVAQSTPKPAKKSGLCLMPRLLHLEDPRRARGALRPSERGEPRRASAYRPPG